MQKGRSSPLNHNIPFLHFMQEAAATWEWQPTCQNLDRPEAIICYFAMQFEKSFPEVTEKLQEETCEKEAIISVFEWKRVDTS